MSPDTGIWQILRDYWAVIVTVVGGVLWIARTEAGMKSNAKDIRGLWRQRGEDVVAHRLARHETNEILKEMREDEAAFRAEVRGDLKEVLKKLGK